MFRKLTKMHMLIIGPIACFIIIAGFVGGIIYPKSKQAGQLKTKYEARKKVADTLDQTKNEKAKLDQDFVKKQKELERLLKSKTFYISVKDENKALVEFWKEHSERLPREIRTLARATGVKIDKLDINPPPVNPQEINRPFIPIPIGLSVTSPSFSNLVNFIRRLSTLSKMLVVVDGEVTCRGPSPNLQASLKLAELVLPKDVTEVAAAAPTGAEAGGMGGMPGMGMPGMGMPGMGMPGAGMMPSAPAGPGAGGPGPEAGGPGPGAGAPPGPEAGAPAGLEAGAGAPTK